MKRTIKKKAKKIRKLKGWVLEHYGLGSGVFNAYDSLQRAEREAGTFDCECNLKPIKCTIIYTL